MLKRGTNGARLWRIDFGMHIPTVQELASGVYKAFREQMSWHVLHVVQINKEVSKITHLHQIYSLSARDLGSFNHRDPQNIGKQSDARNEILWHENGVTSGEATKSIGGKNKM